MKMGRKMRRGAGKGIAMLRAMLREIFDESAYERFLLRNALAPSRSAYALFLREAGIRRERRPRCC